MQTQPVNTKSLWSTWSGFEKFVHVESHICNIALIALGVAAVSMGSKAALLPLSVTAIALSVGANALPMLQSFNMRGGKIMALLLAAVSVAVIVPAVFGVLGTLSQMQVGLAVLGTTAAVVVVERFANLCFTPCKQVQVAADENEFRED